MISGSNRGIGAAIAKTLLQDGYLLSLGVRNPDTIPKELSSSKDVQTFRYDATSDESARKWIQNTVDHFGSLDVLINNAGILRVAGFEDNEETDRNLEDLWRINVRAPFHLVRCALPHLKRGNNPKVINIASMAGKRVPSIATGIGYSMSKHAVIALTHGIRLQCWEEGVRATAICPSFVNTDMVAHVNTVASEKMTQPEDVATLVSTVVGLPQTASVSELYVSCRAESQY